MTGGWTLGTDSLGPMCKRVITSGRNRSETSQYHDEHDRETTKDRRCVEETCW